MGNDQVELRDWEEFEELCDLGFDDLVEEYNTIAGDLKELSKRQDQLKAEIGAALTVAGHSKVKVGNLQAILADGKAADQIDGRLLVQAGVAADIVAGCTVPGRRYTYIQVREIKEGKGGRR